MPCIQCKRIFLTFYGICLASRDFVSPKSFSELYADLKSSWLFKEWKEEQGPSFVKRATFFKTVLLSFIFIYRYFLLCVSPHPQSPGDATWKKSAVVQSDWKCCRPEPPPSLLWGSSVFRNCLPSTLCLFNVVTDYTGPL